MVAHLGTSRSSQVLHVISLFCDVHGPVAIKLSKDFFNDAFIMINIDQDSYKPVASRFKREICSIR